MLPSRGTAPPIMRAVAIVGVSSTWSSKVVVMPMVTPYRPIATRAVPIYSITIDLEDPTSTHRALQGLLLGFLDNQFNPLPHDQ